MEKTSTSMDPRLRAIALKAGGHKHLDLMDAGYTREQVEEAYYWSPGAGVWVPKGILLWRFVRRQPIQRDALEIAT